MATTLNHILNQLSDPPQDHLGQRVSTLPIAHLTSVRSFLQILENNTIQATHCDVFRKNLLYCSYGAISHRYHPEPTADATRYPVAFLFSPDILQHGAHFFPYDTGATTKSLYAEFNPELRKFWKYRFFRREGYKSLLSKIVYYTYGSNEQYINSRLPSLRDREIRLSIEKYVSNNLTVESDREIILRTEECLSDIQWESNLQVIAIIEPLIRLIEFLRADLTAHGADRRQRIIECQILDSMNLAEILNNIIWIGLPSRYQDIFLEWCFDRQLNFDIANICPYDTFEIERPDALARVLERDASRIFRQYY
jgi:hypothetical protein